MSTLNTRFVSAPIFGTSVQPLVLQTNNIDRLTIDESGNVQVAQNLVVTGSVTASSVSGAVPAGTVIHVAMNAAPSGYLKANGQAVSRSVYAALFAAIGTTYGAGNGTTTFNVPDLRGEFLRGWDDGRGVDSGRAIGTSQTDQNRSHSHTFSAYANNGTVGGNFIAGRSSTTGVFTFTTNASGDAEARPRNVALLACIKF